MVLIGKKLKEYKKKLQLTEAQRALVVGSILGDGSLRIPGRNLDANFIVEQGEKQKDYLFWKYEIMKEWILTSPKRLVRKYYKEPTKNTISWRFLTIAHSEFTELYRDFYQQGVKIIPDNIEKILKHPLTLAVWTMDDGSKSGESFFLNTQNFTKKEQEGLLLCLRRNFGIEGKINVHSYWNNRTLYRIRIKSNSVRKLYEIVKPHILSSLEYKFPLYPRNDLPFKAGGGIKTHHKTLAA